MGISPHNGMLSLKLDLGAGNFSKKCMDCIKLLLLPLPIRYFEIQKAVKILERFHAPTKISNYSHLLSIIFFVELKVGCMKIN